MNQPGMLTIRAVNRDGNVMVANVTTQSVIISVESEGEITIGTESLVAAIFTDGQRSGATTVVKNQGLVVLAEVLFDLREQLIAKIAVFGEISA